MGNESANSTPTRMPGHGNRWRQALSIALLVGSTAATLLAVTVVISLFWWVSKIPAGKPEDAPAPKPRPAAESVSRSVAAAAPAPAPAVPRPPAPNAYAKRSGVGTAPVPDAVSPQAAPPQAPPPPRRRREPDAEKNQRIAAGLERLAKDPEALRRLGLPAQQPRQ
jgi:hypothetical protein